MELDFKRRNWYWAVLILFLCLYSGCGDSGSDGSSSALLPGGGGNDNTGGGGGNDNTGTVPGTGNATVQFGSTRFDGATGTAVDSGENVYVVGNTWGTIDPTHPNPDPTASTADIFISKYNAAGMLQWIRQLGSPLDDYATGISVDNTGNVIVVGYTFGDLFGGNKDPQKLSTDFFILKLDPNGNQIWSLQDGTPTVDELWSVATDYNNDIYVCGGIQGDHFPFLNSGGFDSLVSRYSSAGNLLWRRVFTTVDPESSYMARAIVKDEARGSLYVAGTMYSIKSITVDNVVVPFDDYDISVEKLNPVDGSSLWGSPYIFSTIDSDKTFQWNFATGIAVDREGYIYVGGYDIRQDKNHTSNAGDVTFELFKLDSSSNLFWHSYMPAGAHPGNEARGVVVDSMKDVYLIGYTSIALGADPALGGTDAFIMQFDGDTGATLWTKQFGTAGNDRAFGIAFFDNRAGNNYYVVGETFGSLDGKTNSGGYDAFLVRYDQFGSRL
jgi:hypothetical protein